LSLSLSKTLSSIDT